jgi:putative DNA primase/helicase
VLRFEEALERLDRVRRRGDRATARCPAHEDKHSSLSIGVGSNGRILLHCFAGCSTDAIVAAIGWTMSDLFVEREGGGRVRSVSRSTVQRSPGCRLEEYAEAKRLPVEFLEGIGLSDCTYMSRLAVRIPYLDMDGVEAAVRFRIGLVKGERGDDRFRWRKGSKPLLYGLWRLSEARAKGYVLLVEGESDCHTCWFHGYPAVGLPGAALWREQRDAAHLDGISVIYVVIEPDRGGESVLAWLERSRIRERVRLVSLPEADSEAA